MPNDQLTCALVMPRHHCLQLLYICHVNKVVFTLSQYFAGVSQPFTGRLAVKVRSEEAVCQLDCWFSAHRLPEVLK